MVKLRLLGAGPAEDIPCVLFGDDDAEERARAKEAKLRAHAHELQRAWCAKPKSRAARLAFAGALHRWGELVGDKQATFHADELVASERWRPVPPFDAQ